MYHLPNVELALAALLLEPPIGYPWFVYRAIGHPVTWMGALLGRLETLLNRPSASQRQRRMRGILTLAVLLAVTAGAAHALDRVCSAGPIGVGVLILAATSLL